MFNVSIAGRLTKDAEYKKAGAYDLHHLLLLYHMAKIRTSFVDCQVWGKRWELIVDAYKKGSLVAVSGDAEYTTYETDDGQKRKQLRVNVNNFVLPEKREQSEEAKRNSYNSFLMAIRLDIKSELPKGIKWTNQHTKQLPFSIAQAINASVQGSKFIAGSKQKSALNTLAGSSRRYLDRPKPSTQKGFRATVAKKSTLTSVIKTKERPYNQDRYLGGNIFGGDSKQKYDALLVRHTTATNIPANSRLVPHKIQLNDKKHGNITKTTINKDI